MDGELVEMWSKEEFRRCLLATALYLKIVEKIECEGKANPELKRMKRFRYHALSLAGRYLGKGINHKKVDELFEDSKKFDKCFSEFWSEARRIIIDALVTMDEQSASLQAYIRSVDRWESMPKKFSMYVEPSA